MGNRNGTHTRLPTDEENADKASVASSQSRMKKTRSKQDMPSSKATVVAESILTDPLDQLYGSDDPVYAYATTGTLLVLYLFTWIFLILCRASPTVHSWMNDQFWLMLLCVIVAGLIIFVLICQRQASKVKAIALVVLIMYTLAYTVVLGYLTASLNIWVLVQVYTLLTFINMLVFISYILGKLVHPRLHMTSTMASLIVIAAMVILVVGFGLGLHDSPFYIFLDIFLDLSVGAYLVWGMQNLSAKRKQLIEEESKAAAGTPPLFDSIAFSLMSVLTLYMSFAAAAVYLEESACKCCGCDLNPGRDEDGEA